MATAHDVASLMIQKSSARGKLLDKMQLQKLLFMIQGVHLMLWNTPAMTERFLAYQRGPVVRGVEQTYRDAVKGVEPITQPIGGRPEAVSAEVSASIDLVLDTFGSWSAIELEAHVKTDGSPWRIARGDLDPSEASNAPIDVDAIRAWFAGRPLVADGSASVDLLEVTLLAAAF